MIDCINGGGYNPEENPLRRHNRPHPKFYLIPMMEAHGIKPTSFVSMY